MPTVKLQHWCGLQSINGCKAAPVLEFSFFLSSTPATFPESELNHQSPAKPSSVKIVRFFIVLAFIKIAVLVSISQGVG